MASAKCNWHMRRALLGMAILVAASQPALADTKTLICPMDSNLSRIEDEPATIELNEAASTVIVHFGAWHLKPNVGIGQTPAFSIGPLQAVFGTEVISFSYNDPPPQSQIVYNLTLNRLTGALRGWTYNMTCHVGNAQF